MPVREIGRKTTPREGQVDDEVKLRALCVVCACAYKAAPDALWRHIGQPRGTSRTIVDGKDDGDIKGTWEEFMRSSGRL